MSTTHQAHNIPWSRLTSNLVIRDPSPQRPTITRTQFCPADKHSQSSDLQHFARRFAETIRTFAETERAKYPATIISSDGKVVPDEYLGTTFGHRGVIQPAHQTPEFWKSLPDHLWGSGVDGGSCADVIKRLYNDSHVASLLYLAQMPERPLKKLRWITYSNFFHYGTDRVYQDALQFYILLNVHVALGLYGDGYREIANLRILRGNVLGGQDYDAQAVVHEVFFDGNDKLQDVAKLKPYLKRLFSLIYISAMVLKEAGEDIDWELETERTKFPALISFPDQKVLPGEHLGASFVYGRIQAVHQTPQFWKSLPSDRDKSGCAAVIKGLCNDSHINSVLWIAQLPEKPLKTLQWITYSDFCHQGPETSRVYNDTLQIYLVLNVHIAMVLYGDGFREIGELGWMRYRALSTPDYDTHSDMHRPFFEGSERLQDLSKLKPYLKHLKQPFRLIRLIYVSAMVIKESSVEDVLGGCGAEISGRDVQLA